MFLTSRITSAFVLSLLLFGMQLEAQRHAIAHLGDALRAAHEQGVQQSATDVPCAECALLAGASHALPGDIGSLSPAAADFARGSLAFVSYAVPAPSFYSSRAPPALL